MSSLKDDCKVQVKSVQAILKISSAIVMVFA